jgi:hypothetical protein
MFFMRVINFKIGLVFDSVISSILSQLFFSWWPLNIFYSCHIISAQPGLPVFLHFHLYFLMSSFPYICLSVCLSFCMSAYLYVCLSVCLPICMSAYLYVCLSVCLPICMFAYHPIYLSVNQLVSPGNTKGGSITAPLTSCLTGLESAVWQLTNFVFNCKTD